MSSQRSHLTGDTIDYNAMIRNALLDAVRELLMDSAENGLRGDHHYYLAFNTTHPGVRIPSYLKAQHPKDMTIVLQNQFWDLTVTEDFFSVKLSFNSNPEELIIPFDALVGFLDPSVQFALQFKDENLASVDQEDQTSTSEGKVDRTSESEIEAEGENVVALDAFRKQ